jgi:hypothetical protein
MRSTTAVGISELSLEGALYEIDAIAVGSGLSGNLSHPIYGVYGTSDVFLQRSLQS